jgi:hypothetical protein
MISFNAPSGVEQFSPTPGGFPTDRPAPTDFEDPLPGTLLHSTEVPTPHPFQWIVPRSFITPRQEILARCRNPFWCEC